MAPVPPTSLEPGANPGGVVVHHYGLELGADRASWCLLTVRALGAFTSFHELEGGAESDAWLSEGWPEVLTLAFDGDSGAIMLVVHTRRPADG